jgi:zinc protease
VSAVDRSVRPAPGPLRPYHFPALRRTVLPNGLQIAVASVHAFPVATVGLVLPSGALADPAGKAGLASITVALLESGAGDRDAAQVARRVDGLGLSMESFASWDLSEATFTCLRERLDDAMALLGDLVLRPTFPAEEVERLRDQRLASLTQSRADPSALGGEVTMRALYGSGSRFGLAMAGTMAFVSSIGREDVAGFHATHYRPAGATLYAAGDVTLDDLAALAERHFGAWTGAPEDVGAPAADPTLDRLRLVMAHRPGAVQSALRLAHPGPARHTPDFFPLLVGNAILGGTFSSRLNMNLRERLGYTYGASSGFTMRRDSGIFSAATAVQTEVTAHALSEMLRDMREIREAEVTDAELESARAYLAGSFPVSLQTTDGVASKLETLIVNGLPDDYFDTYRERIMAVTAGEVKDALVRHLHPGRALAVVAGDAEKVAPELEALALGPVEVVEPAEMLD